MIVHDRRATLIDFESSRDPAERRPRVVEATKAYASPEQLFGGGSQRSILPSTDLFSWALTVCQMFAPGRHPYRVNGFDEAAMSAIDQAVQCVAPPRPDLDALPPGGLRDAAARALSWQPAERGPAGDLLARGRDRDAHQGAGRGDQGARLSGGRVPRGSAAPEPAAATPPRPGCWGTSMSAGEPRVAYAGGAVPVAFAAA